MQDFLIFISEQWLLVGLLLLSIYAFVWHESRRSGLPLTSQQVVLAANKGDAVLIDIREQKEFAAGHIAGAIHFRYAEVANRQKEIAKMQDKKIVLIDKLGQGTGPFAKLLTEKGLSVARLKGGMMQWQNENLPVVKKK